MRSNNGLLAATYTTLDRKAGVRRRRCSWAQRAAGEDEGKTESYGDYWSHDVTRNSPEETNVAQRIFNKFALTAFSRVPAGYSFNAIWALAAASGTPGFSRPTWRTHQSPSSSPRAVPVLPLGRNAALMASGV